MSNLSADFAGRLAAQADAMGRLAHDPGAFAAAVAAFESRDPDAFRWVLDRLELLPRCELICEWIQVKAVRAPLRGDLRAAGRGRAPAEPEAVRRSGREAGGRRATPAPHRRRRRVRRSRGVPRGSGRAQARAVLPPDLPVGLLCPVPALLRDRLLAGARVPVPDPVADLREASVAMAEVLKDEKAFAAIAKGSRRWTAKSPPRHRRGRLRPVLRDHLLGVLRLALRLGLHRAVPARDARPHRDPGDRGGPRVRPGRPPAGPSAPGAVRPRRRRWRGATPRPTAPSSTASACGPTACSSAAGSARSPAPSSASASARRRRCSRGSPPWATSASTRTSIRARARPTRRCRSPAWVLAAARTSPSSGRCELGGFCPSLLPGVRRGGDEVPLPVRRRLRTQADHRQPGQPGDGRDPAW